MVGSRGGVGCDGQQRGEDVVGSRGGRIDGQQRREDVVGNRGGRM